MPVGRKRAEVVLVGCSRRDCRAENGVFGFDFGHGPGLVERRVRGMVSSTERLGWQQEAMAVGVGADVGVGNAGAAAAGGDVVPGWVCCQTHGPSSGL